MGDVDLLVFNPPYVPSEKSELGLTSIEAAWAGGEDGREVIDLLLPKVRDILSPKGVFYLVLIEQNKPQEIIQILKSYGLYSKVCFFTFTMLATICNLFDRLLFSGRLVVSA
jgi:release factor glutamine methyltransferase